MKDLEKEIDNAASKYANDHFKVITKELVELIYIDGVKSKVSKEYWQQEMYSEEEVKKIALYAAEHAQDYHMKFPYEWFDEWFEQNKKK